jgi:type IV pilus assembly protein PilB
MGPDAVVESTTQIGQALVEEGIITTEQLSKALKVQSRLEQPRSLSDVLVEMGLATKKQISDTITKRGNTMRLGDLLLAQGLISQETLNAALISQRESGKMIGAVLVDMGAVNQRTLLQQLAHQKRVPYIEPSLGMIDREIIGLASPDYMEKNLFVPFSRSEDGILTIVVSDLANQGTIAAIDSLFSTEVRLALGPLAEIKQTIDDYRRFRLQKPGDSAIRASSDGESVTQLVEHVFTRAINSRASDIHIEPMADRIRLRFRIDGELVFMSDLPIDLLPRISTRLKILAECNIAEHQKHQGGRFHFDLSGKSYDMRLSTYVGVHGECMTVRILNKEMGLVSLDELGMCTTMLRHFREDVLDMPTGVVLITGPTGSGKTTTLYSSLDYCNGIDTKIITVEDPVEYMIDGLIQCSVNEKAGRTFESSLREIVRQDPDIIVLGEIRDRTSAEIAIQAALTGHKVYSTFHTEDTIGGLVRLLNMEIEAFLISSTVISVLAQRLLRRICSNCSAPGVPTPQVMRAIDLTPADVHGYEFKKGRGCKNCNFTGYYGRIAVYELLVMNDQVKEAILAKTPSHQIRQISVDTTGLISMREDAIAKVFRGHTTFEEVLKNTPKTFRSRPVRQVLALTQ